MRRACFCVVCDDGTSCCKVPGDGPKCHIIRCRTAESAPASPPTNLQLKTAALHELVVEWSPPAASNGVITGYRLFYDTEDSDEYKEVELPDTTQHFKAICLDPGVTYRFQVLAFTEAGDGPHTDIVEVQTLESATSRAARLQSGSKWSKKPVTGYGSKVEGGGAGASAPEPELEPEPEPDAASAVPADSVADWKTLRHTGQHKMKRASKDDWMTKSSSTDYSSSRPTLTVGELASTRPGGAAPGYGPDPIMAAAKTRVQLNTRAFRSDLLLEGGGGGASRETSTCVCTNRVKRIPVFSLFF